MSRGEKPIEPRYSWFSAKTIEVVSYVFPERGKALEWLGGVKSYQPIPNSEYVLAKHRKQSVGAKVGGREGISPDHQIRSPSND